jgi:hypothetical protein
VSTAIFTLSAAKRHPTIEQLNRLIDSHIQEFPSRLL